MNRDIELRWVLIFALGFPIVTVSCGGQISDPGGDTPSGSGGHPSSSGTGGSSGTGTGGASAPGTGGADISGTGGSLSGGTGGATTNGTGGASSMGTGGSSSTGTGGASSTGTGGSSLGGHDGNTGGSGGTGTGGTAGRGGPDAGTPPDPFSVAPTCTSGTTWKGGNQGSANMNPGKACIACHKSSGGEAPGFSVAGTLYPTAHEPDLCNGSSGTGRAQVVITGADGKTVTLTPNSVGNFSSSTSVKLPYQAKVLYMGQSRAMVATQSTGDCNSCHTQNGMNGAPGRILLP